MNEWVNLFTHSPIRSFIHFAMQSVQIRSHPQFNRLECLGNWAVVLRHFHQFIKFGLVHVWNHRVCRQFDQADGGAVGQMHLGSGVNFGWCKASTGQLCRQKHRKAASMGRANQLFGVRALAFFEALGKGIRGFKQAAAQFHCAISFAQRAFPLRFCCFYCHFAISPKFY